MSFCDVLITLCKENKREAVRKMLWHLCLPSTIILIAIMVLPGVIIGLSVSKSVLLNYENGIQLPTLENRGYTYYGIQSGRINGRIHSGVQIKVNGNPQNDVILVLSKDVPVVSNVETINATLSTGNGVNEMYSYKNFTYIHDKNYCKNWKQFQCWNN